MEALDSTFPLAFEVVLAYGDPSCSTTISLSGLFRLVDCGEARHLVRTFRSVVRTLLTPPVFV
jgi:hypothetical protein